MQARMRALVLVVVTAAVGVLYVAQLRRAPIYLNNDEAEFALQAHAVATTGRDLDGRLLPLYFHVADNVWFHPALVYVMTPFLAIARPTPTIVRLPTALLAVGIIMLLFVAARRLGLSFAAAVGASGLLALTPAFFMHGRLACDYIYPVPCVLGWLILLIDYQTTGKLSRLFAAGCMLGLGLYTYVASLAMMPWYLILTYAVLFASGVRRVRPYAAVTAGFVLPVLPLAVWLAAVPDVYAGFVQRYHGAGVDVVGAPVGVFRGDLMVQRWAIYRSFFERSFLFERAESNVMSSTYTTGVFLKAMAVLMPIGAFHLLRNRRTPFTALVLAGFLSAPLAASLIHEPYTIDRAIILLPMGALLGGFGLDWLLDRRGRWLDWAGRAVCVGLGVWMVVQFNGFYRDYMTDYRVRSAFWFNGNFPGAFEPIVWKSPTGQGPRIYLSGDLPWIHERWKLHLLGSGRTDLLQRTTYFSPQDLYLKDVPSGSLLLTGAGDFVERSFLTMNGVRTVAHAYEPDGSPTFTLFERTGESVAYAFDGTYEAKLTMTCTPEGRADGCISLPTTAACPSMETVTVANGIAMDSCGYLSRVALGPSGSYGGQVPLLGLAVAGDFSVSGAFRLSGSGTFKGGRYQVSFLMSRR